MTRQQYMNLLAQVSNRVFNLRNYQSFNQFHNDWLNYFHNIYIPYSNGNLPPRIFIAESAPDGIYNVNANYIFKTNTLNNNICSHTDMYLYRYYRGIYPIFTPNQVRLLSKLDVLIQLSQQNILIIDLLPTHGIKLETNERYNIMNNLLNLIDYNFLNAFNFPNNNINYAFSVPPSLYSPNMCSNYLNNNFVEYGNVNMGQGHAPSIQAIIQIVQNGF
jgi:hypothetical protein